MEITKKIKRYNWLALLVTVIAFASCTHQNPNVFVDDDNDLPSRAEQKGSEAVREEEETPEQAISVDAPDNVLSGDEFTITYTVNGDARKFNRPSFDGFRVLGQSSQSININGNQNTSISYTLVAGQEGAFEIDPATCTSNGKKITSPKVSIHVAKPTAAQQKQRQRQQQQQKQQQLQQIQQIQQQQRSLIDQFDQFFNLDPWGQQLSSFSEPKIDNERIFVRTSVSDSTPYLGEQTIVTCKLYYDPQMKVEKDFVRNSSDKKSFWTEELTTSAEYTNEVVNGHNYRVRELAREALFPMDSGVFTFDPDRVTVLILDHPFAVEHTMRGDPLSVDVRPLPSPPDDFSGGVGRFTIEGGLSADSVKAGDPVSYKITISGQGNLTLITPPTPQFPDSFATDNPEIIDEIAHEADGISGSRTYRYTLIPRNSGTYSIPAYRFIYFDPEEGNYATLTIDALSLTVLPGDSLPNEEDSAQSSHFISILLYILSALALVIVVGALVYWLRKKFRSRDIDPVAQRKRNALRIAQRRLKKAKASLSKGEPEPFYQEIYHAIWGCLSDKYGIPTSHLNRDTVTSCLLEKQVPEEQQQRIHELLNAVDLARFAPGDPKSNMQHTYQLTLDVISEI